MATKVYRIEVCDVCGTDGQEMVSFRISEAGGESRKVTLCGDPDHGYPKVRSLVDAAKQARHDTRPPRARVSTMDEVRAAIRKPPKAATKPKKAP